MYMLTTLTGWIFFLVFVVGLILSLTATHRSKFLFAIAFAVMALATLARQVMYLFLGNLLGGGFYGGSAWGVITILLSLLELGGFVVLLVGVRLALTTPSAPPVGMPTPYGVPPTAAPAYQAGPVCRTCGTPGAPGQPQGTRCGAAL